MDTFISLIVVIISQHILSSNYVVHFKYTILFVNYTWVKQEKKDKCGGGDLKDTTKCSMCSFIQIFVFVKKKKTGKIHILNNCGNPNVD